MHDMDGADKGKLVTNGELVNRYNVALSRQCDGFDSRTFRKKYN